MKFRLAPLLALSTGCVLAAAELPHIQLQRRELSHRQQPAQGLGTSLTEDGSSVDLMNFMDAQARFQQRACPLAHVRSAEPPTGEAI